MKSIGEEDDEGGRGRGDVVEGGSGKTARQMWCFYYYHHDHHSEGTSSVPFDGRETRKAGTLIFLVLSEGVRIFIDRGKDRVDSVTCGLNRIFPLLVIERIVHFTVLPGEETTTGGKRRTNTRTSLDWGRTNRFDVPRPFTKMFLTLQVLVGRFITGNFVVGDLVLFPDF